MNRRFFIKMFASTVASASVIPFVAKKIITRKPISLACIKQHRFDIMNRITTRARLAIQKEEDERIFKAIDAALKERKS